MNWYAIILAAWITFAIGGYKFFRWQEWDAERRIQRVRKVAADSFALLSEKPEQVDAYWTDERVAAYEAGGPSLHSVKV
jgi:hypothetical protein